MSIICMLRVGVQSLISLHDSMKLSSLNGLSLSVSSLLWCVQIIPLYKLESVYWFQIVFTNLVAFPCLMNSVFLLKLICPVNSVLPWCSQPIVCWLYKGWEWMGWSDLTELQERPYSIEKRWKKSIDKRRSFRNVQLKGTSLAGWWRYEFVYFNMILHASRG